jgi:hypothetical protein
LVLERHRDLGCGVRVSRRSNGVAPQRLQNVASKNVRGVVPGPPHAAGSSAPLSVEVTSTRQTLTPHHSSSNGGVTRIRSTKFWTSVWNLASSDAW